jgi:hypothetical protein
VTFDRVEDTTDADARGADRALPHTRPSFEIRVAMSYAFISKKSFVIGRFFNTGSQFSPSQATEDDRVLFGIEVRIEVGPRLGRCKGCPNR